MSNELFVTLILSWLMPLSYRNQSIDLQSKSMDWFLYDNGLRHERANETVEKMYAKTMCAIFMYFCSFCSENDLDIVTAEIRPSSDFWLNGLIFGKKHLAKRLLRGMLNVERSSYFMIYFHMQRQVHVKFCFKQFALSENCSKW